MAGSDLEGDEGALIEPLSLKPKREGETRVEPVDLGRPVVTDFPKTRFDVPSLPVASRPLRWPLYLSVILMLLVVVVWFAYLGERTKNKQDEGEGVFSGVVVAGAQVVESVEEGRMKEAALQVQAEYRFAESEWAYRQASEWSLSAYESARLLAEEGEGAFGERAYASSSNFYRQAIGRLGLLEGEQPAAVSNLVDRARVAFAEKDFGEALVVLELALMLDPEHVFAGRLLRRTKVGPGVSVLLVRGAEHEEAERWALAHADYQEAVHLDMASGEARTAFNRIKERMVESGFQRLMSEGLSAFSQGNYTNALVHLIKAKAYRPESSEVKDALVQVKDAIRRERLEAQREEAEVFEGEEAWGKALAIYMEVLEKDPLVEFARQGRLRAMQQLEMLKVLRSIVRDPDGLLERKAQQYAHRVLAEVKAFSFRGEALSRLAEEVEVLLEALRKPVEVTLTSDGMTRVSVYKVGRFGVLSSKVLDLVPGTYTLVGARSGYRDVRISFVLKPGSGARTVEVLCRDKI